MEYIVVCPDHPEAELIEDHRAGDVICRECGLIVGDRVIDVANEWRSCQSVGEEAFRPDPCRVGAAENPMLTETDLSTTIGKSTGPAGLEENGAPKYKFKRQVRNADRVLTIAYREISNMAARINLPQIIVDRANNLFKKLREMKTVKGSNEAVAASCLYFACRQESAPRSFKEICAISKVPAKQIGRCYKLIVKATMSAETDRVETVEGKDLISRFGGILGLAMAVKRAATCIAERALRLSGVGGRSPSTIAAVAIYMACQASADKRSRKEVGDVVGVSEATMKQTYKLMYPHAAGLFPEEFTFVTPIAQLPKN